MSSEGSGTDASPKTASKKAGKRSPRPARRFGYTVAIAVNLIMLYVANNLLSWEFPSFLTEDFERVLPAIRWSLGVTIATNVLRIWRDPPWFVSVTTIVSTGIGIWPIVRMWRVYPFDFETWAGWWDPATKVLLVIAGLGSVLAIISELVKLARLTISADDATSNGETT